jgi:glycosyl transferase, family 25
MQVPKDLVDVVVISLPDARKRRAWVTEMFAGTGLKWSFFDAHNGLLHPGLQYNSTAIKRQFGRTLSVPEIAVYSSHVAVLREFLDRGLAEYILVLEDDVIYDVDFPLIEFAKLCSDQGIEYIRLFGKHYAEAVRLGFFFDRSIVRYKTTPAGAQAYLISRKGARLFIESVESVDATVDLAMDSFWKVGLPIYSIFPYPIIERYSPTSIPIPPSTNELAASDQLASLCNRAIRKAKKMIANAALNSSDRAMRRGLASFSQIF